MSQTAPAHDLQLKPVQDLVGISPAAAQQFQAILSQDASAIGIRLGVSGGGCAGLQYQMTPCTEAVQGDLVQETHGVTFYIHPMAAPYLKGMAIDYSGSLLDGGFKFSNPNATNTCGCGTSFGI